MSKKDKKGFWTEFKEFAMRGNVFDMAIGVIIAGAFGKITTSLVNDIFMPALGYLTGGMDLTQTLNWEIAPAVLDDAGVVVKEAVTIGFGTLITTIINFILIAFVIFLMIKIFAKTKEITEKTLMHKKEEEVEEAPAEPAPPTSEELLAEILTELKKQNKE